MNIEIRGDYIELNKLLKLADIAPTGGIAGEMIADGLITVNGELESRKKRKVYPGMTVTFEDQNITVIGEQK